MASKTLEKELRGCNVLKLRRIAHALLGKGTWISVARKDDLIERLLASPEQEALSRHIKRVKAEEEMLKKETLVVTPRMRRLLQEMAALLAEAFVSQIKTKAQMEGLL